MNVIKKCIEYISPLFEKDFSGHDIQHTMRVYKTALKINEFEKGDKLIVSLTALLHDVDDYKLFSTEDNENARRFLNSLSLSSDEKDQIIDNINSIAFKGKESIVPKTIEGKIVQDADRLDAIGAIGIARAFSYGGKHDRKLYDLDKDVKKDLSFEEYKKQNSDTLSHFYQKLFLLEDMMNTDYAKKIAKKRTEYIKEFVDEFLLEIEGER